MRIADLLAARAAAAVGRQQALLAAIPASQEWDVDAHHGQLTFKDGPEWHVQILGTATESNNTWLWAWADERSRLPDAVVKAGRSLERYGLLLDIEEFTEEDFKLGGLKADYVALLSTAVLGDAAGFYRCSFPGGGVYVLVTDERAPRGRPSLAQMQKTAEATLEQLGAQFDHRTLLEGYGWSAQLNVEWHDDDILGLSTEEGTLSISFGDDDQVIGMEIFDEPGPACNLRALVPTVEEAEAYAEAGFIDRVPLMPFELGGDETSENMTFLPPPCAVEKCDFDAAVAEAAQKGLVSSYAATPMYDDDFHLPTVIELVAEGPRPLKKTIDTRPYWPMSPSE